MIVSAPILDAPPVTPVQQEIVVTGRGLSTPIGEAAYANVEIGRERLTGSASNRLEDILRDVPGFQLFRRSDARSANPTSQGATLRALGGNASSRALLILDGVPHTDPFGGWVSWPAYDPRRLAGARITRGGGSGAQGPGALAGTIELTSAGPADLNGLSGELSYGSRNGIDAFAAAGARLGGGFAGLSASYARGQGFIPIVAEQRGAADRPAPYEQYSLSARAVAPLGAHTELQASGLHFSDARERGTAFSNILTRGSDASLRLVGSGRWAWSALGYVQTRDFYNSFAGLSSGRATASRVSEQYDVPSTGLGARFELRPPLGRDTELRIGADARSTAGESKERYNYQAGAATRLRAAGGRSATIGAFVEGAWQNDDFTLTGGARIDRWQISEGFLSERVIATGATLTDAAFPDRSGLEATARAGFSFRPRDQVTLRGAAYLGWRLPTLNELYRPFRVGPDATAANPALEPERLKGVEAGLEYRPAEAFRIGITLFAARLQDAIANVTLGQGPGTFPGVGFVAAGGEYRQRRNLQSIDVRGIEIDAELRRGPFRLTAGYSFADAEVRASGPALPLAGLRPAQTPRHMLSSSLAWEPQAGRSLSVAARYVGNQFEDDLNAQLIPAALTFDAAATLPLSRRLAILARAENLTDARVIAAISGDGTRERATPRTLWIGLRLRP